MSVRELESLRKKTTRTILIGIAAFIISIKILDLEIFDRTLMRLDDEHAGYLIFSIIGVIVITTLIFYFKNKYTFVSAFKETFVLKSLQSVFTDLVYEPEKGLDQSIIKNTGMMNMGDSYSSNDYVSGKYKNINVVQADVCIKQDVSDHDEPTHYHTLFKGRWMIFDFNKNFKANIQVCEKDFMNSKLGDSGDNKKYEKVMMEDQEFNNMFRTYAQNEHEAFYVLTPPIMEKIKKLAGSVSGKLLFCFVDSKLHVGIHNKDDSFEPSVFSAINEEKVIKEISKDIQLITDFVDELSLDNNLFRKEV